MYYNFSIMAIINPIKEKIKLLKKFKWAVIPVSVYDWESIENLKKTLNQ